MTRPRRSVRVQAQELEGRLLLTALPAATVKKKPTMYYEVQFIGTPNAGLSTSPQTQVVSQQASTATLMLSRALIEQVGRDPVEIDGGGSYSKPLQVEVKTDPSSPAVGVNVGAVDQTVTFGRGQSEAALRVPIFTGAANPGEVDVTLTATPINAPTRSNSSGSLELRILAPDASLPPTIIAEQGTRRGIVLAFNKPMNPAAASNVHNYAVSTSYTPFTENAFESFIDLITLPVHMDSSLFPDPTYTQKVPLRAAEYDPATDSVTLVPKRRLSYLGEINVSQGSGMKTSSGTGQPSSVPIGLTDLEGNPINEGTIPGKFYVSFVPPGNQL